MPGNIKLLVKTVLIFFSLIGCAYETISILDLYFSFPYNVMVSIQSDTDVSLPGITFCSDIGVRLSSLQEMEGFNEKMKQLKENNCSEEQQQILDEYSLKFRREKSVETLLRKSIRYSKFFNTSYTKCACDEQTGGKFCSTYGGYVATFQKAGDKCFTLFHATNKSQVDKCRANIGYSTTPELMSNETSVGDAEPSEIRLQPKEIIRFQINFESNDTVNLDEPSYATMLIHENFMIPATQRYRVIRLKPGYYYEIYIQAQRTVLLESPFDSKCRSYLKGHKVTEKKPHPIFDTPSSRRDCMVDCLGNHTIMTCGCWPPELPYATTVGTGHEGNLTLCVWDENSPTESSAPPPDFKYCFARFTPQCTVKCNNDCIQYRYTSEMRHQPWPSDEVIKVAGNDSRWTSLRKCCATISVRYATGEITVYQSMKKYETIEFISYVGGLISLWLGFSVIGMYDYFNFFYHLTADRFCGSKEVPKEIRLQTPVYTPPRNKKRKICVNHPERWQIYGRKLHFKGANGW
ncbi:hypothetical protein HDE_03707 [Halotydeus destructor]|nr:hypothetical protein HDE_03707 [Halotydeus destructor]